MTNTPTFAPKALATVPGFKEVDTNNNSRVDEGEFLAMMEDQFEGSSLTQDQKELVSWSVFSRANGFDTQKGDYEPTPTAGETLISKEYDEATRILGNITPNPSSLYGIDQADFKNATVSLKAYGDMALDDSSLVLAGMQPGAEVAYNGEVYESLGDGTFEMKSSTWRETSGPTYRLIVGQTEQGNSQLYRQGVAAIEGDT